LAKGSLFEPIFQVAMISKRFPPFYCIRSQVLLKAHFASSHAGISTFSHM